MTNDTAIPGLLDPLGIVGLLLVFGVAYFVALRWHRARPGRPHYHMDVAAIGLLALLTGGFFWRVLTEASEVVRMPAGGGDLASFYFPGYAFAAQQIQMGTIPLWNPHLFSGIPFAADVQMGLFYPLNWVLFLFYKIEYEQLEWLLIAHYWLAATFTYLFLRDIGLRRLGGLAGAVAFAFCGFMTAHLGHMPMILVATWLPLELLFLRRALLTKGSMGWVWSIAAGLTMAVALVAGHVQIFSYEMMAAGVLWLYLFAVAGEYRSVRDALPWVLKGGLALALALGVSAVQLLPTLELSTQSIRSAVSYEEASQYPAQPVSLLNLFLPRVYGTNPTTYSFGPWQNTENWSYGGVVTLALAAAGLSLRRARMVGFFALLVVLALVLMVGDLSIVGAWVYKFLPGFSKLRDAGRALILLGFGFSGLAAYGLDALVAAFSGAESHRRKAMWWLVGTGAALVIVVAGILPMFYRDLLVNQYAPLRLPDAINDLGMLTIWIAILVGAGWAAYTCRMKPAVAGSLMLLTLVLDIFSPNSLFNPSTQNILSGYQFFDAINVLTKQTRNPSTGIKQRMDSDTNVQNIWQPSTALLASAHNDDPLYDTGGAFDPLKLERYDYIWGEARSHPDSSLYDLLGASLQVISPTTSIVTVHAGQPKWEFLEKHDGFDIYRNKNAMPRVFLVHEARIEQKKEDTAVILWRQDIDPRHTVVLQSGEAVKSKWLGTAEAQPPGGSTGETVRVTRYTPNAVDITVNATQPGWVVLTDAWYPGWEASVNGKAVAVEPGDYAFRAVKVDKGPNTILMQFRPASWQLGRVISLVSLAGALITLIGLLVLPRRRRIGKKQQSMQSPDTR